MSATPLEMAFIQGAKWWQFFKNGSTAFPSEVDQMEAEAKRRPRTLGKTEDEVHQMMRERKEEEGNATQ